MFLEIPTSLRDEHHDYHDQLARCMKEPGLLGEMGRLVERQMHLHCVSEEDFALPPLGLLPRVARGEITDDMADIVPMTRRLKAELPRLFAERVRINLMVDKLREAAYAAGRAEYVQLADALKLHARIEEEVLYPAAIVLGDLIAEELRKRALVLA